MRLGVPPRGGLLSGSVEYCRQPPASFALMVLCLSACGARSGLDVDGDASAAGGRAPVGSSTMASTTGSGGASGSGGGPCAEGESRTCYSGPPGTLGVGVCAPGTQACDGDRFGPCTGEVLPAFDDCSSGEDEDCDGSGGWVQRHGGSANDAGVEIAVDPSGNVIMTGRYSGPVDFGGGPLPNGSSTVFVVKLDGEGNHVWSRAFPAAKSPRIAVDGSGVVLVGEFQDAIDLGGGPLSTSNPGFSDMFIVKLDSSGGHVWSKVFGGVGNDTPWDVAFHADGSLLLAGQFGGYVPVATIDFGGGALSKVDGGAFVVRLSEAGDHVWSKGLGKPDDAVQHLAIDGAGNALIAGPSEGPIDLGGGVLPQGAGVMDFFVAKLSPDGVHVWSHGFGGLSSSGMGKPPGDVLTGIAATPGGGAAVTGFFSDVIDFGGGLLTEGGVTDVFVGHFDGMGAHLRSAAFGSAGSDVARAIAVDGQGRTVVAGQHWGEIDLGGEILPGAGGDDIFIAKFDVNGDHLGSETHGGEDGDVAGGLAVDASGAVFFVGSFSKTISFACSIASAGAADIVVAKLGL